MNNFLYNEIEEDYIKVDLLLDVIEKEILLCKKKHKTKFYVTYSVMLEYLKNGKWNSAYEYIQKIKDNDCKVDTNLHIIEQYLIEYLDTYNTLLSLLDVNDQVN